MGGKHTLPKFPDCFNCLSRTLTDTLSVKRRNQNNSTQFTRDWSISSRLGSLESIISGESCHETKVPQIEATSSSEDEIDWTARRKEDWKGRLRRRLRQPRMFKNKVLPAEGLSEDEIYDADLSLSPTPREL